MEDDINFRKNILKHNNLVIIIHRNTIYLSNINCRTQRNLEINWNIRQFSNDKKGGKPQAATPTESPAAAVSPIVVTTVPYDQYPVPEKLIHLAKEVRKLLIN